MAKLTKTDVENVATLAKLDLSAAEIEKFLPQLSRVVEYVSELSSVDTGGIEPTSQTTGLENIFRKDEVVPSSINQDAALSGTDNFYNGYFKIGAILTERSDK